MAPSLRSLVLMSYFTLAFFCAAASPAFANPAGGTVSAGQANISSSGNTVTVTQQSGSAVINWSGFNIAPGETTQFIQPSSSSIALNRVNSNSASMIDGTLKANGDIIIVNQNGVVFGSGALVDVNGLIATTANISDNDFMNSTGKLRFNQPGNPNAAIINNGTITAANAGLVGMVAPNVINNGVITANLGRVQLASGDTATVDLYGDKLMEVAVSNAVTSQLVANTGVIQASGGKIALTAAAGKNIVNSLISVQGELLAPAVSQHNGEIDIYAAGSNAVKNNVAANKGKKTGSSTVEVSGYLDVSGYGTGQTGGNISVLGDNVGILSGTLIDASGDAGGGTIKIGGDFHGQGTTPTALNTYVDSNSLIMANANTTGNGGNVTVWSDGNTWFGGNILAEGGLQSGNGGYVETSGHGYLNATGYVDLLAPNGSMGTYLLDPTDISIYGNVTPAFVSTDGTINLASSLQLWLDASNANSVSLSYNDLMTTATGSMGGNSITVGDGTSFVVGERIQIGSSNSQLASVNDTANVYTVTAISGNTITLDTTLATTAAAAEVYGGYVSQIHDLSGQNNNAVQSTASAQPLWISNGQNGLGVLSFNGSSDYMVVPYAAGLNPLQITLEAVYMQNGDNSYQGIITNETTSFNGIGLITGYNVSNPGSVAFSNGSYTFLTSTVNDLSNYVISTATHDGATHSLYVDSGFAGSSSQPLSYSSGNQNVVLGRFYGNDDAYYLNGPVGETLLYNASLSNNARNLVEQYQSAKWGVALTGPGVIGSETGLTGAEAQAAMASVQAGATTDGYSVFTTSYLNRLSQTSDIILDASHNINLDLQGDTLSLATGKNLTLIAGNQITTNSVGTITANAGNITFNAANGIVFNNAFTLNTGGGNINLDTPTLTLNAPITLGSDSTLSSTATQVNVGANGLVQNGIDAAASGATVNLAAATYDLTNEITIGKNLTLNGDSTSGSVLDGQGGTRVMEIDGTPSGINVNLNHLTLENGNGTGTNSSGNGGGLLVYAESGNQATVTVTNSTISGNSTGTFGGGIFNDGENSGNATLTINNSTISANFASDGGAITNEGDNGNATTTINASTLSGNSVSNNAGAIYNGGEDGIAILNISNSTIANNAANYAGAIENSAEGGGANNGMMTITNSTISGNTASGSGGGILNIYSQATLVLSNSILAGNTSSGGEDDYLDYLSNAHLVSSGYNIFGQNGNTGGFVGNGTTDIKLSGGIGSVLNTTLANNGGPTKTLALVIGSVAIDNGDPSQIGQTDQRGFVRGNSSVGTGSASDIGAYEAAILNVSADEQEIIYGNALSALTYTLNSGPTGYLSGNVSIITSETNAGTYSGDIGIGTLASTSNAYLLDFTPGELKIDQRTVTIDPTSSQTKIYGTADPTLTYTTDAATGTTGLVNSDVLTGAISYSGAGQYANVGNDAFTAGTLTNNNYNIVMESSAPTFAITQRTVTVDPTSSQTKIYGTTDPTLTYTTDAATGTTGLVNSDTFTGGISYSGAGQYTNVGNYATTLGTLANGNYNIVLEASAPTFGITVRTVTVDPTSAQTKIYGTTDPALTYTTDATTGTTGLVNGNTFTGGISYSGAGQYTSVGDYATTLGTLANSNYNIVLEASAPTFGITQRTVTVDPTASQSKIYGITDPTLTYTTDAATGTTGLVNGNMFTGAISYSGAGQYTNVGNYTTTLGTLANSNYNIVLEASAPTFGITVRTVTVDPTASQSKIYGVADPTIAYTTDAATGTTGLVNSDTLSGGVSYSGAGQYTSVGNYATTLGTLANNNYNIVLEGGAPTFGITVRTVTVDPTASQSKIYGVADPTIAYTTAAVTGTTGLVNSDTLSGGVSYSGAGQYTNVGNYATTLGTLANSNYNIVLEGGAPTFGITVRTVTVDPTASQSKIYGVVDPTLTYATDAATGTAGLVNSDTLSGAISYSGAGQYTNVGNYATTLGTLANSNYNIVLEAGAPTFGITARTVTVDPTASQNKIYGVADPTIAYTTDAATGTTGLVNGGTLSGGVSYSGAGQYTSVGNYATTLGTLANSNYNIVLEGGAPTFGITARTVTVDPTASQSKIYGVADPTIVYTTDAATGTTGLVNSDTLSGGVSYSGAGQYTSVGNYATTLGTLANSNYNVVLEGGASTFGITVRTVTVDPTASQSKIYGVVDPTIVYTTDAATGTTGLVNGDTLSGSANYSGAGQYTSVGNYAATLGTLANSNYNIVLEGSAPTFAINQRAITIDPASGQTKIYGIVDPALTYSAEAATGTTGLVNGDALSGAISYSGAGQYAGAGNDAFTLGTLTASGNYAVSIESSAPTFAITQRAVTVDPTAGQSKIFGTPDPNLTYTTEAATGTTGLVNGDTLAGDISYAGSNVGTYAFTLGTLANSDYNIGMEGGAPTFSITPAASTVPVIPQTVTQVSQNPPLLDNVTSEPVTTQAPAIASGNQPIDTLSTAPPVSNASPNDAGTKNVNLDPNYVSPFITPAGMPHGMIQISPELAKRLNLGDNIQF